MGIITVPGYPAYTCGMRFAEFYPGTRVPGYPGSKSQCDLSAQFTTVHIHCSSWQYDHTRVASDRTLALLLLKISSPPVDESYEPKLGSNVSACFLREARTRIREANTSGRWSAPYLAIAGFITTHWYRVPGYPGTSVVENARAKRFNSLEDGSKTSFLDRVILAPGYPVLVPAGPRVPGQLRKYRYPGTAYVSNSTSSIVSFKCPRNSYTCYEYQHSGSNTGVPAGGYPRKSWYKLEGLSTGGGGIPAKSAGKFPG
eukprot:896834-Rhodomonas_salina.1